MDKFDIVAKNYSGDYLELAKEIYKAGLRRGYQKANGKGNGSITNAQKFEEVFGYGLPRDSTLLNIDDGKSVKAMLIRWDEPYVEPRQKGGNE